MTMTRLPAALALCCLSGAALADTTVYPASGTWQQIATAGQSVTVSAQGDALFSTGSAPPALIAGGGGAITGPSRYSNFYTSNNALTMVGAPGASNVLCNAVGAAGNTTVTPYGSSTLETMDGTVSQAAYPIVPGACINLETDAYSNFHVHADTGLSSISGVSLKGYTVATLPTCAAALKGKMVMVTDATSPTYNAALTGGGSVPVPAFCSGSAWTSH